MRLARPSDVLGAAERVSKPRIPARGLKLCVLGHDARARRWAVSCIKATNPRSGTETSSTGVSSTGFLQSWGIKATNPRSGTETGTDARRRRFQFSETAYQSHESPLGD